MNLEQFLQAANVDVRLPGQHHHATSGRIQVDCPFCSPGTKRFRMGLAPRSASCWTCGPHRIGQALQAVTHVDWKEIIKFLGDQQIAKWQKEVPTGRLKLPDNLGPLSAAHKMYLLQRGFKITPLESQWKIQGLNIHEYLGWRVFIPIFLDNEVVSWTTRSIRDDVAKRYVSAGVNEEKYPHKKMLYNEDNVHSTVLVTEGPLNVWAIDCPGAVALLGTAYTKAQVFRIAKYPKRYICLDNTEEAQRQAKKLCNDLSVFPGETINIVLETGKDPAEIDKEELDHLRSLLQ